MNWPDSKRNGGKCAARRPVDDDCGPRAVSDTAGGGSGSEGGVGNRAEQKKEDISGAFDAEWAVNSDTLGVRLLGSFVRVQVTRKKRNGGVRGCARVRVRFARETHIQR